MDTLSEILPNMTAVFSGDSTQNNTSFSNMTTFFSTNSTQNSTSFLNTTARNSTQNNSFFSNKTCYEMDNLLDTIFDMRESIQKTLTDPNSILVASAILAISLIFLVFGERLVRVIAAACVGVVTFMGIYRFTGNSSRVSCTARILTSSLFALVLALATSCLIKFALFVIGAFAFGGSVHFLFSTFPQLNDIGDMPTIADKSALYWILIVVGSVCGGLLLRWNSKPLLEILTSIIGGTGLSYSLHGIAAILQVVISDYVLFAIAVASACGGTLVQRQLRLRAAKKKREKNSG